MISSICHKAHTRHPGGAELTAVLCSGLLLEVGFYFGKLCGLEVLELLVSCDLMVPVATQHPNQCPDCSSELSPGLCTLLLDLPDGVVAFRFKPFSPAKKPNPPEPDAQPSRAPCPDLWQK